MGVYDEEEIYDKEGGLGEHAGPDFEEPKTYAAAPDVAEREAAATGDTSAGTETNSATEKEKSVVDSLGSGLGGFVKDPSKFFKEPGKAGKNLSVNSFRNMGRRRGIMIGVGLVAMIVITIISMLYTFNIPSAEIRAAGNGLITTYFGSQIVQGKIHMGNYWNGMIDDVLKQDCTGKTCTISMDGKASMLERFRAKTSLNFVDNLKSKGITLAVENGKFTGIRINTEVEGTQFSGQTDPDEIKKLIKQSTGIDVTVTGSDQPSLFGDTFEIAATEKSILRNGLANKSLVKGMLNEAGYDRLFAKWTPMRNLSGLTDIGFKPLIELRGKAADKVNGAVDSWVQGLIDKISNNTRSNLNITQNEEQDGKTKTTTGDTKISYDSVKQNINKVLESKGGKAAGGALAVAGLICVANELYRGTSALKMTNYYGPTGRLQGIMTSASDQISSVNQPGVDYEGQEAYVKTFLERKDANGNIVSFSDSAAYKAMNGVAGGVAMEPGDALAAGLKSAQNSSSLQEGFAKFFSEAGTAVCSGNTGNLVAGAGIVIMVLSGPFAVLEGGALALLTVVGTKVATNLLAGPVFDIKSSLTDPARTYNNAAQGARNMADMTAWLNGGDPQSSADHQKYKTQYLVEQTNEFNSKSIAYKLFNTNDPLSVASKVASKGSVYPSKNVATLVSSFTNIIPNIAKRFGTIVSPKASAASTAYSYDPCSDTKYGCIGYSDAMTKDSGARAIAFFKNPNLDTNNAKLQYMKTCRDIEFYKDGSGVWTYKAVEDTPAYVKYETGNLTEAECNDPSMLQDQDIIALKSYINLTPMAAGAVCQDAAESSTDETDIAACQTVGYGIAQTSSPSTIDTSALYQDSTSIACDPSDSRLVALGVQTVEHDGATFKINICGIKNIKSDGKESTRGDPYYINGADGIAIANSRVAKAFADLADNAAAAGVKLSASSTFRLRQHQQDLWDANPDPEAVGPPGKSNHEVGIAMDFNTGGDKKSGAVCSTRARSSSAMWEYLNGSPGSPGAQKFGIYQYAVEPWHWDASPTRCKDPI